MTRPPATSAPTRRSVPSPPPPIWPSWDPAGCATSRRPVPRLPAGWRPRWPRPAWSASTARPTSTSSRCACPTPSRSTPGSSTEDVLAGLPLARWYPDDPDLADALLLCATELTTDADIDRLVAAIEDGADMTEPHLATNRPRPILVPENARRSAVGPDLQPTLAELHAPGRSSLEGAPAPRTGPRRHPRRASPRPPRPPCPRSTSPPWCTTSCASRTSTTRSTAASTRWAPAP